MTAPGKGLSSNTTVSIALVIVLVGAIITGVVWAKDQEARIKSLEENQVRLETIAKNTLETKDAVSAMVNQLDNLQRRMDDSVQRSELALLNSEWKLWIRENYTGQQFSQMPSVK